MPNRFTPIQTGTDPNQQLAIINKNFAELDNENVKKLFYDSNGTPSIMIGVQQDGSSAIRVAKPGRDVTVAGNADLAFNSAQNTFKIVLSDVTVIPQAIQAVSTLKIASITIPHNLGYIPIAQVYGQFNVATDLTHTINAYLLLPYDANAYLGLPTNVNKFVVYATVDITNLYITYLYSTNSSGGYTFPPVPIKYYLLQETAA